jgi:signal peptidase II
VPLARLTHHWQRLYFLAALIWIIDYSTKVWALNNVSEVQPIKVIGSILQLRLVFNPGAAFSFGTSFTFIFTILAILAVVVIASMQSRSPIVGGQQF